MSGSAPSGRVTGRYSSKIRDLYIDKINSGISKASDEMTMVSPQHTPHLLRYGTDHSSVYNQYSGHKLAEQRLLDLLTPRERKANILNQPPHTHKKVKLYDGRQIM